MQSHVLAICTSLYIDREYQAYNPNSILYHNDDHQSAHVPGDSE
jgi:hypothetical protein